MSDWFRKHRADYPANWEEIATRIKDLAGNRCEACGIRREACGSLGVHHVDRDPAACADANLVALCSRCHLRAHGMRPRPQSKAETVARLRTHWEIALGQLCFALSVAPPPRKDP